MHVAGNVPIQDILHAVGTTVQLCALSWNKGYSLFPLPTFIQHKGYILNDSDAGAVEGFPQRGWNIQGVMWPEEKRCNHPIRERRRVGDRYTWIISFDTSNVEASKTPDSVLEFASFNMDLSLSYDNTKPYDAKKEDVRYYAIEVDILKSKVLKHTYCYGDVRLLNFLTPRLHSSTILEVRKLQPGQRPANHDQIMRNRGNVDTMLEGFNRPAAWIYRDDEFSTWYRAFEEYCPE